DIVEVYLRLVIDGTIHGSQPFAVSMEELEQLGISILPDNFITTEETGQGIHIQAWFEKESRTYYHRDELKMTVMADKNCYFKIIHIDANSQMKMIYPNSYSTNNQLTVNTPRVIFENESVGYMLYEPYGTEVIQLVASTEQFKDIEQEYIIPRRTATSEIIRPEVVESRGGDLEATGEAKYIITVLKPHEEYEFKKPSNMTEAIEALRSDALRQGGVFEGNEQSGYYTMNGVRGSYRILAPDTLQMAVYYPDNHTGGPDTGIWRRGSGFNFSFERPANISQAVQAVRSGIEDKGGTFTGNEQQGSFKASGIAGQYRVSEMVNVTITEKPFIVPNSLIEKEVRNYFIGSEKR
ncbi:MAG: DUF4384 domain-containing protein, partial [Treponema sp.]|nr:DUF4384 domain-containing protein [Treponema sp.]